MSHEKVLKEPGNRSRSVALGGILLILIGVPLLLGGVYIVLKNQGTDADGFTTSNISHVNTTSYAYAIGPQGWDSTNTYDGLMAREFKWIIINNNPDKELFVGITQEEHGYEYLKSFQSVVPQNWKYQYSLYTVSITIPTNAWPSGALNAPTKLPSQESFWMNTNHSTGTTSVTWNPTMGKFYLFIMNQDGSKGINADIQLRYKIGLLSWLPFILLPLGLIFSLVGLFMMRRRKQF